MRAYLQLPDIKGNITTKGYEHWIGLESVHHDFDSQARRMVSGHSGARFNGQTLFGEFEVVKAIDVSSPLIFQSFCQGTNLPTVKITLFQMGTPLKPYLEYELSDVVISQLNRLYDGGYHHPYEIFHLSYTKIQEKFTPYNQQQKAKAPIIAAYDVCAACSL